MLESKFKIAFAIMIMSMTVQPGTSAKQDDPVDRACRIIGAKTEHFQPIPFGEIRPRGWLKAQMQNDLDGFVGHLDQLVPDLMCDSIYGTNRLRKEIKLKNLGNISNGMESQYLWWNSETQSNWRDGYIRHVLLLDDKLHMQKVDQYVQYILSTQDDDGYLGIYSTDLRYHFDDENGELWAKTTLLRGLLAYYEVSQNEQILAAIKRAVADVIQYYPPGRSSPFKSKHSQSGGLTHGLVFTDILDRLHQITGDKTYWDYALFLYKDFSQNILAEDGQYQKIIDRSYKLKGHGVHTYEQLRPLLVAYFASGNEQLKTALAAYLNQIAQCTTPAGGCIGDEWIAERTADATKTGYEYCSLQELLDSYCLCYQKLGYSALGDKIENLFFNAAQGARHPFKSCIAYCKTDNSYEMTGDINHSATGNMKQTRYKYSPAHQDVAVCCVPNAGRIAAYYLKSMWMRDKEGVVATLLGPNELRTKINDQEVEIIEETSYPFRNSFQFNISMKNPTRFTIKIRKPEWVIKIKSNCQYAEDGQYLIFSKHWATKETLWLEYSAQTQIKEDLNGEKYFTYGGLVFGLPISASEIITKTFPLEGFYDYQYKPTQDVRYKFPPQTKTEINYESPDVCKSVWESIEMKTILFNETVREKEVVILFPVGATILRQLTFAPIDGE